MGSVGRGSVILEWAAVLVTLIAAALTTLGYDPYNVYFFNVSSIMWALWAFLIGKPSIVVVNLGMLAIYSIGTIIRI
jgi:hypothetical protein